MEITRQLEKAPILNQRFKKGRERRNNIMRKRSVFCVYCTVVWSSLELSILLQPDGVWRCVFVQIISDSGKCVCAQNVSG